jgi:hypothetical protein
VAIRYIFWSFWYIFSRFGILYQEKAGNPDQKKGGYLIRGKTHKNVFFALKKGELRFFVGIQIPERQNVDVEIQTTKIYILYLS